MPAKGFKTGHARGNAYLDLGSDQTFLNIVGGRGVDLHPAVHRAGMHDQGVRRGPQKGAPVKSEHVEIFTL